MPEPNRPQVQFSTRNDLEGPAQAANPFDEFDANPFDEFDDSDNAFMRGASDLAGGFNEGMMAFPKMVLNAIPLGTDFDNPQNLLGNFLERKGQDLGLLGQSAQENTDQNKGLRTFGKDIATGVQLVVPAAAAANRAATVVRKAAPAVSTAVNTMRAAPTFKPVGTPQTTREMLVRPIMEGFRRRPGAFSVAEGSAALGSALGMAGARELAPENQTAEMAGAVIGGVANPTALAVKAAPKTVGGITKLIASQSRKGTEREAAKRISRIVTNRKAALKNLKSPRERLPGTAAQDSGDPGLLALERTFIHQDVKARESFSEAADAAQKAFREQLETIGQGSPQNTRAFFEARSKDFTKRLKNRTKQAVEAAAKRLEKLTPKMAAADRGRVVREEIDNALVPLKATEKAAWAKVPDYEIDTTNIRGTFKEMQGDLFKKVDTVPAFLKNAIGEKGVLQGKEPISELQAFRSQLLRLSRAERAQPAPDNKKIAAYARISESIMDSIRDQAPKEAKELEHALAVSSHITEVFRKGPIGKIRGYTVAGDAKVVPEAALETLLKQPGVRGGTNLESLFNAADTPQTREAVIDEIRDRFVASTVDAKTGVIVPAKARTFLKARGNKDQLNAFPELRDEFRLAVRSQDAAIKTAAKSKAGKMALADKNKQAAALYLNAKPGQEVNRILNSAAPAKLMKQAVRVTRQDPTGGAERGLKASVVDELFGRAAVRNVDIESHPFPSGKTIRAMIDKPAHKKALQQVMSDEEMGRIESIVRKMEQLDKQAASGQSVDELLRETPDVITELAARVTGSRFGAFVSGARSNLIAMSAGSKFAREFTDKIPNSKVREVIKEAIFDKKLMTMLLEKPVTIEQATKLESRLNAYLVNILPLDEDNE